MKHRLLFITMLVALVAVVGACVPVGTPAPPASTPAAPTPTPGPPTPTSSLFPMTLTDDLGREVTLSELPQRIVSLAPSNTEILFAVGAGDQVVGVTQYCNYPPAAQEREQIGGFSAKTISVEKIVALEPDLVLAAGAIHQPVIEALEQINIPVYALDPNTLEEVYARIELVGRLTGHEAEAAQVVNDMQERVAAVTKQVEAIPAEDRLTVYWEVFDEPRMTAGPETFTGQLIELAGGINIFADVNEDYPQISDEEVIARNPAVIMGPETMGEKLTIETVAQRPGWDQIDAVKNARIYLFDGDMVSRSGPRLAQVLELMAQALYPDLFE
ncbi:MAG: ABC transporter substrate-binding protein [Anaerolineae bacterium]